MNTLGRYLQAHLAGAGAGIDLFGVGQRRITDRSVVAELAAIRSELLTERRQLVRMAEESGVGDARLLTLSVRLGAQVALLGPRGNWMRRTSGTDVALLEAMRDAVSGKIAGWQALLAVVEDHPQLDRDELENLLAQAERQLATLIRLHRTLAERALAPE